LCYRILIMQPPKIKPMIKKEEFSFSKRTTKKLDPPIRCFKNKAFGINYSNVLNQYKEEIKNYKKYPELMDIAEFSMNYSFGYLFYNNIDDMTSKQEMFMEVKSFLENVKIAA